MSYITNGSKSEPWAKGGKVAHAGLVGFWRLSAKCPEREAVKCIGNRIGAKRAWQGQAIGFRLKADVVGFRP